jgi:glycosyltransferase involved in cell wall biosynthesis
METIFHKYGGVETYVDQLSRLFANEGHRVFIVSMSKNSSASFRAGGVTYFTIPIDAVTIPFLPKYPVQMLLFNIKSAATVRELNRRYKFDIVHAQFCCGFFYAILKSFWRDDAKFVVTLHGTLVDEQLAHILPLFLNELGKKRFEFSALAKSLKVFVGFFPLILMEYISVKLAQGIIASSYDTLRNAKRFYRIKRTKATVIYSGINLASFSDEKKQAVQQKNLLHSTFNILYVGRADERKGISLLIEAASVLISRHKNVRFFLVGSGTEEYYPQLKRKGIEQFFAIAGKVSPETLSSYYLISDIFVLPSLYEGFGLVALEAFAAGKPVVAFNVASLPEIIKSGYNGILVDAFDPEKFASSIEVLMKDDSRLRRMSLNAKETAEKFTWQTTSDKTIDFYKQIMETSLSNHT